MLENLKFSYKTTNILLCIIAYSVMCATFFLINYWSTLGFPSKVDVTYISDLSTVFFMIFSFTAIIYSLYLISFYSVPTLLKPFGDLINEKTENTILYLVTIVTLFSFLTFIDKIISFAWFIYAGLLYIFWIIIFPKMRIAVKIIPDQFLRVSYAFFIFTFPFISFLLPVYVAQHRLDYLNELSTKYVKIEGPKGLENYKYKIVGSLGGKIFLKELDSNDFIELDRSSINVIRYIDEGKKQTKKQTKEIEKKTENKLPLPTEIKSK